MGNVGFFLGCLFMFSSEVFVWSKFCGKKINFKNPWLYISVFFLSIVGMFNSLYSNAFLKIIIITFFMCLCNWLVFKNNFNETFISVIYGQLLCAFADLIFAVILISGFDKTLSLIKNDVFDTFIANVIVSIIYIVFCFIPFIKKIYLKTVEIADSINFKLLLFICLLVTSSISFLTAIIYYDMKSIYVVLINIILLLIYSFIVYRAMNEKSDSIMVKAQNDSLMNSLHQYEDMVDRQRVDNHENKNQLLIIKNMIKKKDKDVVKYIDTIVKDQKEDDEALYTRVMTIPSGGLQGIIYQKMLVMKDEHIKFSLDVGRGVRDFELDKLSMDDNYRLCKIVGVFLDNAIEESRKINDKCIMISLYVDDDNLVIEVSNRFEGKIDIDKLDESGYTTKGDGHGYGLSLVKKILSETDKFENVRSVNRNVFKQIIKLKLV